MHEKNRFWRFLDRIGVSFSVWDLVWKLISVFTPISIVGYGLLVGTTGPYLILAAFAAFVLAVVAFAAFKAIRFYSPGDVPGAGGESQFGALPAYGKSFQRLASMSPYWGERRMATRAELEHVEIVDRVIQAVDIPRSRENQTVIEGKTFIRCTIVGPAILFPHSGAMIGACILGVPSPDIFSSALIEASQGQWAIGIIAYANCRFIDCEFAGVGFMALKDRINELKEALGIEPMITEGNPNPQETSAPASHS